MNAQTVAEGPARRFAFVLFGRDQVLCQWQGGYKSAAACQQPRRQPGRVLSKSAPIYVEVCSLTIRHESRKSRGPTTLLPAF